MKSPFAVGLLTLIVLCFCRSSYGQYRVFSTCGAYQHGIFGPAIFERFSNLNRFCSLSSGKRTSFKTFRDRIQSEVSGFADDSGLFFGDSPTVNGGSDSSEVVTFEDEDSKDEVYEVTPETPVTTSSTGGVPFSVIGGEQTDISKAERPVRARLGRKRPDGLFITVVAVDVTDRVDTVWRFLRTLGDFLKLALKGLVASIEELDETTYKVELENSGTFLIRKEKVDDENRYLTMRLAAISDNVFPGYNYENSRMYIQVSKDGFSKSATNIELGWGLQEGASFSGDSRVGIVFIEGLLLECLENIEARFGEICDIGRSIRTIVGDCNNLSNPPLGSAGTALRRLGGSDPAYRGDDRNNPSGANDISPREISNKLFATSPGAALLAEQASSLTECITTETSNIFCPLEGIYLNSDLGQLIPFKGFTSNECEDLVFNYESSECEIEVVFKCLGETKIELADNPCKSKTNRFFDPKACTMQPGEDAVLSNSDSLTDLFFSFGQIVDHDIGLTPTIQLAAKQPGFSRISRKDDPIAFPIPVPQKDFFFPMQKEIRFDRAEFHADRPLSHVNQHSSYLDGSQFYGFNILRSRLLRSFEKGHFMLSEDGLPPFNGLTGRNALGGIVENGPTTDSKFFVVGDPRGNEQPLLLSTHICFLREHNLIAQELSELFPEFDDERIYETARSIVIAEYQSIIYREWLPLLLGRKTPDPHGFSYNENLDPTISAIFATAAFRVGHTIVGSNLMKLGRGPRSSANLELVNIRDAFFTPERLEGSGLDEFLRGGAWHIAKEIDHKVVDELRNFLLTNDGFDVGKPIVFDLVALNIQRARDMGLPTYNKVRELFGLKPFTAFSEFIADPSVADLASDVYKGDVDKVDLFFGGLAEKHVHGSQVGETFHTIIFDQFRRLRDGDRFFYTGITFDDILVEKMPRIRAIYNNKVTLGDIIARTTGVSVHELGPKDSVFQA